MIRGSPSTVSWPSVSPGSLASISDEVLVAAQFVRGVHDAAHQQVLEVDGAVEVDAEPGEEVLELANPQRLEQDVFAAGEHPVQRRARHAAPRWRCLRW